MPAPLQICADRSPAELRRLACREWDGRASAPLLAPADALEGLPREEAARRDGRPDALFLPEPSTAAMYP